MPADVEPFHAIGIGRLAYELKAQGRPVIHMEFGQPSTGAPRAAIEAAKRVLDADPMGYWESAELGLDLRAVRAAPPDWTILPTVEAEMREARTIFGRRRRNFRERMRERDLAEGNLVE